jgi:hypothetical protein
MGVGVVSDLVSFSDDPFDDLRIALHVHAALKKRRPGIVLLQRIEENRGGGTGAVVEGEGDLRALAIPVPDGGTEHSGRTAAHGPRHSSEGCTRGRYCYFSAQRTV